MPYGEILDKLLTVVIICVVCAAMVPIVLVAFTQLSTSGIVLASLFSTVLAIVLAVFILKTIMEHLG